MFVSKDHLIENILFMRKYFNVEKWFHAHEYQRYLSYQLNKHYSEVENILGVNNILFYILKINLSFGTSSSQFPQE